MTHSLSNTSAFARAHFFAVQGPSETLFEKRPDGKCITKRNPDVKVNSKM